MTISITETFDWDCQIKQGSNDIEAAKLVLWDNQNTSETISGTSTYSTDSSGVANIPKQDLKNRVFDESSEVVYSPYYIKLYKYGYKIFVLNKIIDKNGFDTFYIEEDSYNTVDEASVDTTNVVLNHDSETIEVDKKVSVKELYSILCKLEIDDSNITRKFLKYCATTDGINYYFEYNILVKTNGEIYSDDGEKLIASTKEISTEGDGVINCKYEDKNGIQILFKLTNLQTNTEIRIYKMSDDTEIFGVEDSGDSVSYNYLWTEDIDIYVRIYNVNYEPITLTTTLSKSDTTIPIKQTKDRWYENP